MQVKDLTVDELRLLIRETVTETIQALLFDPDEGKQIKPEVQQQLLDSLRRTQAGERGIPAEELGESPLDIFEDLGLVGCLEGDPNLSTHYKTVVTDYLDEKRQQGRL